MKNINFATYKKGDIVLTDEGFIRFESDYCELQNAWIVSDETPCEDGDLKFSDKTHYVTVRDLKRIVLE